MVETVQRSTKSTSNSNRRGPSGPGVPIICWAMLGTTAAMMGLWGAAVMAAGPTCKYAFDKENKDGRHGEYRAGACPLSSLRLPQCTLGLAALIVPRGPSH